MNPADADRTMRDSQQLVVVARQKLVLDAFRGTTSQTEQIRKKILDADVCGTQSTITDVHAELRAQQGELLFDIVCRGHVTSRTTSRTDQVRIEGDGAHEFQLTKTVFFDGRTFRTSAPFGWIRARQIPQIVAGKLDTDPLIGQLANQVAWSEVIRRSPEVDRAVAEDLAADVPEQVNARIDAELTYLADVWRQIRNSTEQLPGGDSLQWNVSADDQVIRLSLTDGGRMAGGDSSPGITTLDAPPVGPVLNADEEIAAVVSEEFLNNLLAEALPE
ncbi:MAG: hypothetical protein KDA85_09255, partial [Planctomycetaceae bacterium]|nr:hypothetical protein [Planctomycetaceae bacterium]